MIQLPNPWNLLERARDRIARDKKILDEEFMTPESPDGFLEELNKALLEQYHHPHMPLHQLKEHTSGFPIELT